MKLSMSRFSRIDNCENNLRISFMEKKYGHRTAIPMSKNILSDEPLKEIFQRDSSPDSVKNDFDRPFRKSYYGPLPPNRSPSSISLMPQRSMRNVWQRIRSYMSTQKKKSYIGLRKMSSAFRSSKTSKGKTARINEPSSPIADISGTSSKCKESKSKSLGFVMIVESQSAEIHTPNTCMPGKPALHKPQSTDQTSKEVGPKSVMLGTSSLEEGKSVFRGSSLNIKKTIVYTHDLLYLTEEDRKQKHEAERKKQEKEESTSKMDPESKRLHPLREGTQSLLDVINPLSRSPSSHDLNSNKKNVSKKPSVR